MSHFFAMMSRMKYINRWGLMNNTKNENISEHSLQVAMLAHALATISNERLGTTFDENKAALIGIFHDASEILTGDMPTPIKYYNTTIKDAYKNVEKVAENKLIEMLPLDLQGVYRDLISPKDEQLLIFVKAADKLSALIKCIEEVRMGNNEFLKAKESIYQALVDMNLEALDIFMAEFLPDFLLTLDELD